MPILPLKIVFSSLRSTYEQHKSSELWRRLVVVCRKHKLRLPVLTRKLWPASSPGNAEHFKHQNMFRASSGLHQRRQDALSSISYEWKKNQFSRLSWRDCILHVSWDLDGRSLSRKCQLSLSFHWSIANFVAGVATSNGLTWQIKMSKCIVNTLSPYGKGRHGTVGAHVAFSDLQPAVAF